MKRTSSEHRRHFGWLLANDIDGAPSLFDWDDTVSLSDDHRSLNYSTNTAITANALRFAKYLVNREDTTVDGVFEMVLLGDVPHGWTDDIRVTAAAQCVANRLRDLPFYTGQPIRLLTCLTGVGRAASFAQQLANLMGVTVHAPIGFVRVDEDGIWDVAGFELRKGVASINTDWQSEMEKFDPKRTQYVETSEMQKNYSVTRRHFGWWLECGIVGAQPLFEWCDAAWKPDDHNQIVAYLEDAKCVCATTSPDHCMLCTATLRAFHYQSDGVWIWNSSLAHLVKDHHVRLPDEFVSCIRSNLYVPPTAKFDLSKLDWPWGPVGGWHQFR